MRNRYLFRATGRELELGLATRIMGIVNITPDSFSDGGRYFTVEKAVNRCLALLEEGADIIDIGGESTRPSSTPVSAEEELRRVLPVLKRLRSRSDCLISVDTYKAEVANKVLAAGANIINDISGFLFDPKLPEVLRAWNAGVVIMHCRGTPHDMHTLPPSEDILSEVVEGLQVSVNKGYNSKIARDRMILDPGIGFGKNTEENLILINRLSTINSFGLPILVGPSRKRFIGSILDAPANERTLGTAGASAVAILKGAHILRVHDVVEIRQVTRIIDSILCERPIE